MAPRLGERSTIVPVKDPAREKAAAVNSEVRTYKMSPEELEDLRARTGYTPPKNADGEPIKPPAFIPPTSEEQSKRAAGRKPTKPEPSKVEFLKGIAAGKSIAAIERGWGMNLSALAYFVKKWEWKGITPGKARELLIKMGADQRAEEKDTGPEEIGPKANTVLSAPSDTRENEESGELPGVPEASTAPGVSAEPEVIQDKDAEIEKKLEEMRIFRHNAALAHAEIQLKLQEEIERLKSDNAKLNKTLIDTERDLVAAANQRDAVRAIADEVSVIVDNVNHPPHYTAGNVECIDAIEAATIGLTGIQAYCTGAAIKYLWRWGRKGGVEDLQKARWYLDRMINV